MSVKEAWASLEKETPVQSGYLSRRLYPESKMDIFAGMKSAGREPVLIWRIAKEVYLGLDDLPESEGVILSREVLHGDIPDHGSLVLELVSPRFRDVFEVLAQDLADLLQGYPTETQAVGGFLARLKRWQAFLKEHGPDGLGEPARQGLYGELWCLRELLAPEVGISVAVSAWTGPARVMQDFQLPGRAIEVKASASKNHQRLHIASERQLDETHAGTLLLLHLSLDARQGTGETLPAIVQSVRTLVSAEPLAVETFEKRLQEVGYLDAHEPQYTRVGYAIREANYFHVRDDFPRIKESDLRSGVGDVGYTILVSECKHYQLDRESAVAMIRGEVHV